MISTRAISRREPYKLILSQIFSTFLTFIPGRGFQFLITPEPEYCEGLDMRKGIH